jgi:hypothetical protein
MNCFPANVGDGYETGNRSLLWLVGKNVRRLVRCVIVGASRRFAVLARRLEDDPFGDARYRSGSARRGPFEAIPAFSSSNRLIE